MIKASYIQKGGIKMSEKTAPHDISHLRVRSKSTIFMIVVYVLFMLAFQYPGWLIANRPDPFVLGLPFMFFWAIVWWLIIVVTMIYYAATSFKV